ncbi:hypothetical protein BKA67DRAFT_661569 [Truncatella angustata]|uniref:C2H2-type domain-containing protein n=1 Tax=Truncatella angustata TaxID=152316 RepID=A0A9P8ZTL8_9PEZI|nr:uncharacterized protein BKA67DRAFT_661569 [Truncatella angustata]KAH6648607.1 hypothetical protein BKA67DRAFT_661569 [Truncatella angustata]
MSQSGDAEGGEDPSPGGRITSLGLPSSSNQGDSNGIALQVARLKRLPPESPQRLFACPFFKHDPSNCRVMSCISTGWPSIHRLEDHIFRNHRLPEHFCLLCYESMQNADQLKEHLRGRIPCELKDSVGIHYLNNAQMREIKERSEGPRQSEDQKWKDMYLIAFPDVDQSCTPSPSPAFNPDYFDEKVSFVEWISDVGDALKKKAPIEQYFTGPLGSSIPQHEEKELETMPKENKVNVSSASKEQGTLETSSLLELCLSAFGAFDRTFEPDGVDSDQIDGAADMRSEVAKVKARRNVMSFFLIQFLFRTVRYRGNQLGLLQGPVSDSGYGTASLLSERCFHHEIIARQSTKSVLDVPIAGAYSNQKNAMVDDVNETDFNDMETVYTDISGVDDTTTESYSARLAQDLFKRIKAETLPSPVIDALTTALPRLLKSFALNLGYESSAQMHRDAMVFIHRNRYAIAESFRSMARVSDPEEDVRPKVHESSTEIMDRWLNNSDEAEYEDIVTSIQDYEDTPIDEEMTQYSQFIFGEHSYEWLVSRLRRELLFSRADPDAMMEIGETINRSIPRANHVSRRKPPQGANVIFAVDWDILRFLREQEYEEPNAEAIANAITLTGSCVDAQALSCSEYLSQTWPLTGSYILLLIQKLLRSPDGESQVVVETPSKLLLTASIDVPRVIVGLSGLPDFAAEVGEQLAWLSAALRPSPGDPSGVYCTPYVDSIVPRFDKAMIFDCNIKCRFEAIGETSSMTNGQCWHHMFKQLVIARGFPIPRRLKTSTGLELPLNMMAALTRSRYINTFNSKVFIKGFSTMLVPTKRSDDTLLWHLLYNEDPHTHISYLSCNIEHADVKLTDVEKCRHVLGWCVDAVCNTGTLAADYSIGKSNLPYVHAGCALEKVELSAGQFVTGTACFTLGNREKPVHISRFGYFTKLQWISSKYFLFWDEEQKRGWLANGASTLLHLLRASLVHSKRKFRSAFLIGPHDLLDAENPTLPGSAIEVLINPKNRELKLYVEKSNVFDEETIEGSTPSVVSKRHTTYYRMEDRVDHIYNCLEKLIEHQIDVERRSGLQFNLLPRRQLEGWDFKDLVADGDPFLPRVATLKTIGKGWVDFKRSINAVTLFGCNFGELIQPKQAALNCLHWNSLPCEKYYLAACTADLIEIMETRGNLHSNPRRLCRDVIWHMKQSAFGQCPCGGIDRPTHHDPVQALFPLKFMLGLRKKVQVRLEDRGAVVFGHSRNLHWHWKDTGDPVKGDPAADVEDSGDSFNDSGLGSSLSPSTTPLDTQESRATSSLSGSDETQASAPLSRATLLAPSCAPTSLRDRLLTGSKRHFQEAASSAKKRMKP